MDTLQNYAPQINRTFGGAVVIPLVLRIFLSRFMENTDFSLIHKLSSVVGWLELSNMAEADAELKALEAEYPEHPDVLELRWTLLALVEEWENGLEVAEKQLAVNPKDPSGWLHRAYALRRSTKGGLKAAWEVLLPALKKFPTEPTVAYNLACYACQMDDLDMARSLLDQAVRAGTKKDIKRMALQDPDLKPLWREIKKL